MKNQIELTRYEKFRYIQEHKFDIDKCIIQAWDLKPKDNITASWQSINHPEIKGSTIQLVDENINKESRRRFYANLSTEDGFRINIKGIRPI